MFLSLLRDVATASYSMGVMTVGPLDLYTLELPWVPDAIGLGGKHGVSCVPPGIYDLVKHDSPKHPHTFALVSAKLDVYHQPDDVPVDRRAFARTDCLIHVANYPRQLEGCCALGLRRGAGFINDSEVAMTRFGLVVPWINDHKLLIAYEDGVTP